MRRWFLAGAILAFGSPLPLAAAEVIAQQAGSHVGETALYAGPWSRRITRFAPRGQPTFLNPDRPYPQQVFTILIWGTDRAKFGSPEVQHMSKRVCATGVIQSYKGKPEIVATDPGQLSVRRSVAV
jgi:hypothetical protein